MPSETTKTGEGTSNIHYNAVKHRLVDSPAEWPYSSFHAVRKGWYDANWGAVEPNDIRDWWLE
jgi:putative transposase